MAVYTEASFEDVGALVHRLGRGRLSGLHGIAAGIENTNYFVITDHGEWVLTLFERLSSEQLPFCLQLMQHLARAGIPVPEPQADAQGQILHRLAGKPAALVNRLPGSHRWSPEVAHCRQMGQMLARMHMAAQDFAGHQAHLRGLDWWTTVVPQVLPFLDAQRATLMRDELAFQQARQVLEADRPLPRGPIHADLFRDNVVFDGGGRDQRLSGIFDFYFAGVDTWLFDLSVCLNDWCTDLDSGHMIDTRADAMCQAYDRERPLSDDEHQALPAMLRAAAFRFWLSRLWDLHLPRDAALLQAKDPGHFERVLRQRIAHPWRVRH